MQIFDLIQFVYGTKLGQHQKIEFHDTLYRPSQTELNQISAFQTGVDTDRFREAVSRSLGVIIRLNTGTFDQSYLDMIVLQKDSDNKNKRKGASLK
jgi:hypothetical protein